MAPGKYPFEIIQHFFLKTNILSFEDLPNFQFSSRYLTTQFLPLTYQFYVTQNIFLRFFLYSICRDWGHAKDYIEAMWHMLQMDKPDDFVIATGIMHSVREFVEKSFAFIGKEIVWEGQGDNEIGKEKGTEIVRVKVNPKYYRPTEVEQLMGDASKAKSTFGWSPKVSFDELVKDMMSSDIELMRTTPNA